MGTVVGRVCVAGEKRTVSQASADLASAGEPVSGSDASDESVCCRSRRQLVPTWHRELGGRLQVSIECRRRRQSSEDTSSGRKACCLVIILAAVSAT